MANPEITPARLSPETLPEDLRSIVNELDRTDEEARQIVSRLSEDQLNWQPGGGTAWSVAQCLDHLAKGSAVYAVALRAAVHEEGARARGRRGPIQPGWFGRWFIRELEPPPRRKLKAPKKIVPAARRGSEEVLKAFLAAHDELRSIVYEARELDLNRIRFKNPFVGVIRFTVGTGLLIIGAHDRRHLWQARKVMEAQGKFSA